MAVNTADVRETHTRDHRLYSGHVRSTDAAGVDLAASEVLPVLESHCVVACGVAGSLSGVS